MKNNNWQARFKNEKKHFHNSPIPVLTFIKLHKKTIGPLLSFATTFIIFWNTESYQQLISTQLLKQVFISLVVKGQLSRLGCKTHKSYKLFISSWWSQKHIHHIWYTKTSFLPWKITLSKQANQSYLVNVINLCATVWIAQ